MGIDFFMDVLCNPVEEVLHTLPGVLNILHHPYGSLPEITEDLPAYLSVSLPFFQRMGRHGHEIVRGELLFLQKTALFLLKDLSVAFICFRHAVLP